MSLDFLSLAPAGPPARSPIADRSQRDAQVNERDGWEVVASYGDAEAERAACRESVGWADLSHLAKAELNGPSVRLESLSPGAAERSGDGWICPLTPRRGLLVGDTGAAPDGLTIDLTSALAAISLTGPASRETIARFCALDTRAAVLPVDGFRPGSVARIPAFLLRAAEDSFLLLFGAAYGAYLWDVVTDAGTHLGGQPVGTESIALAAALQVQEVRSDA